MEQLRAASPRFPRGAKRAGLCAGGRNRLAHAPPSHSLEKYHSWNRLMGFRLTRSVLALSLRPRRRQEPDSGAITRVLGPARGWPAERINTDQNEAYGKALRALKPAGARNKDVAHRQVKYLNNRIEADHGALKRVIKPARGFKSLPTAAATIKGFEAMRMIRKGQCLLLESGAAADSFHKLDYAPMRDVIAGAMPTRAPSRETDETSTGGGRKSQKASEYLRGRSRGRDRGRGR